jgi:hypothetical protein
LSSAVAKRLLDGVDPQVQAANGARHRPRNGRFANARQAVHENEFDLRHG